MSDTVCGCPRCRCRGLMGPIVLITLGVLFTIAEFTRFRFHDLWPVLLIAIGVVKAIEFSMPMTGHRARTERE